MDRLIFMLALFSNNIAYRVNQAYLTVSHSQNLFDESWTEGNLFKIDGFVKVLGGFASVVISVIGFFIVIFSILRNAMAFLYLCAPEVFDKVDEFKKQCCDSVSSKNKTFGSLAQLVLSVIPNVKDVTQYKSDGNNPDAGGSATTMSTRNRMGAIGKSLASLIISVFLGIAIFFGYPAKIANLAGSTVGSMLDGLFSHTSGEQIVGMIADVAGSYFTKQSYRTDGSQDAIEKEVNKAAKELFKNVSSRYTDMQEDPMQTVAYEIEDILIDAFNVSEIQDLIYGDGYRLSCATSFSSTYPRFAKGFSQVVDKNFIFRAVSTNGSYTYKIIISANDLSTGSTMVKPDEYFILTLTADPVALTSTSSTKLRVYTNIGTAIKTSGATRIALTGIKIGDDSGELSGDLGQNVNVVLKWYADGKWVYAGNAVTYTGRIDGSESAPYLEFDAKTWEQIERAIDTAKKGDATKDIPAVNGEYAFYISLPGSWKLKVNSDGGATKQYTVTEIYAGAKGPSTMQAYSPSWGNYRESDTMGVALEKLEETAKEQVNDVTGTTPVPTATPVPAQ